jgi:hypothetical protein
VDGEEWKTAPLRHKVLSANDVQVPLASLSPAEQQDALITLRNSVAAAFSPPSTRGRA